MEDKTILHEGIMKNQELADWFGIKLGSFKSGKKSKLEELKRYADFEEIYGGVNIKKIYNDNVYSKQGSKSKKRLLEIVPMEWNKNGLDTCSNVANKVYVKYRDELGIAKTTTYKYVLQTRNELWGKPFVSIGSLGKCMYIWCKKENAEDGTIILTQFTEEEQAIKKDLMRKYFSSDEEKDIMIAEMVDAGEITEAEAYRMTREIRGLNREGFMGFKAALEEALGAIVVKGTLVENKIETGDSEHFFLEDKIK